MSTGCFGLEVDGEGWADVFAFGPSDESARDKGVWGDGAVGYVRFGDLPGVKTFGLIRGTSLSTHDAQLIHLKAGPGSASGRFGQSQASVTVSVEAAGGVAIRCPKAPTEARLDGTPVTADYDADRGMVVVEVDEGEHRVELGW